MHPTRKNVTFVLTEECNFACKYCYLLHKNHRRRMPFAVAQATIDYLTERRDLFPEDEAIWEFIGGEPLLEVALIERIIDYVRQRTYELDHPWFSKSWFGMSTNGALYARPAVQRLIEQHRAQLEISLTIDGTREAHDAGRVLPDGRGTYDLVVANVPLWREQFPRASTKVTIAHDNLPLLADSILHLFALGIRQVNANVVFEDVWQPGDAELLEAQLDRLGDELLARELWPQHKCSFFNEVIGQPFDRRNDSNWCGAGTMLAVDADGDFFPCNRFLGFSLGRKQPRPVGNIRDGIDLNRLRPFLALTTTAQSPRECVQCEVASGCAWCQGFNYDDAETPTIYQRATHICAMHKARVRANRRFWPRAHAHEAARRGLQPLAGERGHGR